MTRHSHGVKMTRHSHGVKMTRHSHGVKLTRYSHGVKMESGDPPHPWSEDGQTVKLSTSAQQVTQETPKLTRSDTTMAAENIPLRTVDLRPNPDDFVCFHGKPTYGLSGTEKRAGSTVTYVFSLQTFLEERK